MTYVFAVAVGFALAAWAYRVFHSSKLDTIIKQGEKVAGELDALKLEVAETNGVIASAIVLINGFAAKLQAAIDAGGKPEDFETLRAELDAKSTELAAAIAANP